MNTNTDANELLDRSAALLQSQSTLIDTLLRRCKDLHNDAEILRGTVKATVAERDAMTRKAEDAEAAGWRMRQELDNTADENAKAAREIEDLKARKVKLPEKKPNEGYTRQGAINDTYNSALLDCEDAIRAAGVEVSS